MLPSVNLWPTVVTVQGIAATLLVFVDTELVCAYNADTYCY